MSLRNDPRYFPQPDVPNYGDYTGRFGREQMYFGGAPRSAAIDAANAAAGEKTATSGKYVFDPATGQYTWVPAKPGIPTVATVMYQPIESPQAGAAGEYSGSNAPGGGYGIPGATMVDGISGPTTGLASLANQAAATLGNMSIHPITGLQKTGPLAAMQRSISDALAANVDPSFSHEGRAGRGASIGTAPGGAFTLGPTGLVDIQTPTAEESEARDTSVSGGTGMNSSPRGSSIGVNSISPSVASFAANPMGVDPAQAAANAAAAAQADAQAQAQREAANMASRAQAEREAAAQAARNFDQPGSVASGGGYGGFGGNTGGDGAIGFGGTYAQGGLASLRMADGGVAGYAEGGYSLGGYSDGGRLLRGPGDGVSDSIPATIGKAKQPARLADGEFVVPARIVSELGNGSTEAGARKLYAMLARIQAGRKKSIGKRKVAVNSRMDKYLPA